MADSTITIKTQEYQIMNEVIAAQKDVIESLKTRLKVLKSYSETIESLLECKNVMLEYYEDCNE